MKYILQVVKTKTGWVIKSNRPISGRSGAESEGLKAQTMARANKLASNLSKKEGAEVLVKVFSAKGKMQSQANW